MRRLAAALLNFDRAAGNRGIERRIHRYVALRSRIIEVQGIGHPTRIEARLHELLLARFEGACGLECREYSQKNRPRIRRQARDDLRAKRREIKLRTYHERCGTRTAI